MRSAMDLAIVGAAMVLLLVIDIGVDVLVA
jgi:hypothetical protein